MKGTYSLIGTFAGVPPDMAEMETLSISAAISRIPAFERLNRIAAFWAKTSHPVENCF